MGKAKVVKKPTSPLKISTSSLFQRTTKTSAGSGVGSRRTTMNSSGAAVSLQLGSTPKKSSASSGKKGGGGGKVEAKGKTKASSSSATASGSSSSSSNSAPTPRSNTNTTTSKAKTKASKATVVASKSTKKGRVTKNSSAATPRANNKPVVGGNKIKADKTSTVTSNSSSGEETTTSTTTTRSTKSSAAAKQQQQRKVVDNTSSKSSGKATTTEKDKSSGVGTSVKAVKAKVELVVGNSVIVGRDGFTTPSRKSSVSSRVSSRRSSGAVTTATTLTTRRNSIPASTHSTSSSPTRAASAASNSSSSKTRNSRKEEKSPSPRPRRETLTSDKSKSPSPNPKSRNQGRGSVSIATTTTDHHHHQPHQVTTRKRSQSGSLSVVGSSPPASPKNSNNNNFSSTSSSSSSPSHSPSPTTRKSKGNNNTSNNSQGKTPAGGKSSSSTTKTAEAAERSKSPTTKSITSATTTKSNPSKNNNNNNKNASATTKKGTSSNSNSSSSSTRNIVKLVVEKKSITRANPVKVTKKVIASGNKNKKMTQSSNKSKAVKVTTTRTKKKMTTTTSSKKPFKTTIGKRFTTAAASAASKAKAAASKTMKDERAVAKKLTSKAAKTKIKPKPKLKLRPKAKLTRMASLNAKAILEASFSFEPPPDKKPKVPSSPKPGSVGSSSSSSSANKSQSQPESSNATRLNLSPDLKIEIRSGPPVTSSSSIHTSSTNFSYSQIIPSTTIVTSTSSPSSSSVGHNLNLMQNMGKSSVMEIPGGGDRKRKSTSSIGTGTGGKTGGGESLATISPTRRESSSSSNTGSVHKSLASPHESHGTAATKPTSSRRNSSSTKGGAEEKSFHHHHTRETEKSSSFYSPSGGEGATTVSKGSKSSSTQSKSGGGSSSKGKSPVPRKKAKVAVATAETSTSTSSSWNWDPALPAYHHHHGGNFGIAGLAVGAADTLGYGTLAEQKLKHPHNRIRVIDSPASTAAMVASERRQESLIQSQHYGSLHQQQQHSGLKQKTIIPTPGVGTVYQPAGPLIEPHKTSSSSVHLPESVRLPPDLKVTYQTHPPASVLSSSSSPNSIASSGKSSSYTTTSTSSTTKHSQSTGTKGSSRAAHHHQSSGNSKQPSSQSIILHQPYKSSSSSSSASTTTTTTSTSSRNVQSQNQQSSSIPQHSVKNSQQQTVNFSVFGSSGTTATLMAAPPPGASTISQHTVASGGVAMTGHLPLSAAATAAPVPGMYYPGFPAPHQSPFAPKYPMVPPDSYRAHSPYPNSFLYGPATPQPSPQNFYMTPFYTPPMTPTTTPILGSQPRPTMSAAAAAAAYYQVAAGGGPVAPLPVPSSHHPSNYFVPSPAAAASHHSIPSQPSPGHAGHSLHPACTHLSTCPSTLERNNNISTKSISTINNKLLPQQPQQQPCPIVPESNLQTIHRKSPNVPATANISRRKDISHPPTCLTPNVAADPPKTIQNASVVMAQARQLESAKTFTEQYSLPDDITITPIPCPLAAVPGDQTGAIVTSSGAALPVSTQSVGGTITGGKNNNNSHQPNKPAGQKQRDIVHVIDPRSGQTTTIAKHISTSLNAYVANQNKNVGSVKPNNAGSVGKINSLDVIVLPPGHRPADSLHTQHQQQHQGGQGKRQSLLTTNKSNTNIINNSGGNSNNNNNYKNQRNALVDTNKHSTVSSVNLVQPLPQVPPIIQNNNNSNIRKRGENPKQGIKRKGILECIDGLQKKKMRLLEEENNTGANKILLNGSDAQLAVSALAPTNITPPPPSQTPLQSFQDQQKSQNVFSPHNHRRAAAARAIPREEIFEMRNSTIVNEREAMVAASALVVPANGTHFRLSLHKNGLKKGSRGWHTGLQGISTGHNKLRSTTESGSGGGEIKITTRSSAANAKIKTRSSVKDSHQGGGGSQQQQQQSGSGGGGRVVSVQPEQRSRSRLLRKRINHGGKLGSGSDSSRGSSSGVRLVHNNSNSGSGNPYSLGHQLGLSTGGRFSKSKSPGSLSSPGSSGSGSNNSQVILRIPRVASTSSPAIMPSGSLTSMDHHHRSSNLLMKSSGSGGGMMMMTTPMTVDSSRLRYGDGIHHKSVCITVNNGYSRQRLKSHGWRFEGEPFEAKVYLKNDQPVIRRCYGSMKHEGGDVIQARDCVLLKSGPRKTDLPFVAKVAALWENPIDGEMMFSLLWYYRPEHTELGRTREDMPDEIFASKHRDCNSVATIEDRCYVLTLNEYCRYKKRLKQLEEGIFTASPIVPLANSSQTNVNLAANIALAVWFGIQTNGDQQRRVPAPGKVSPEVVFFCRKVYDYRQKRMLKNPS